MKGCFVRVCFVICISCTRSTALGRVLNMSNLNHIEPDHSSKLSKVWGRALGDSSLDESLAECLGIQFISSLESRRSRRSSLSPIESRFSSDCLLLSLTLVVSTLVL
jgi:hypothetical protein